MNVMNKIAELANIHVERINKNDLLVDDIGLDSLDGIELIMWCEDEYDIEISDDEAMVCKTVGDVINFLTERGINVKGKK